MIKKICSPPLEYFWRHIASVILTVILVAGCRAPEPVAEPTPTDLPSAAETATPENTVEAATATPNPTSTPEPSPTFDINTVGDWGSGQLIFDISERDFGQTILQGVFALDIQSKSLTKISIPGTQLLSISPDHQAILTARENELFLVDLASGTEKQLADDYFHLSPSGARWDHSTNLIYYVGSDGSESYLVRYQPTNGSNERLTFASPIAVVEADQGVLTWGKGSCNPFGDCTYTDLYWINDEGDEIGTGSLDDSILLPCQRSTDFTFSIKAENDALSLHILSHDQSQEAVFWSFYEYSDCAWAPDNNRLAVTLVDRFWYSGSIQDYFFQILTPATNKVIDLSYFQAPLDSVDWSPDGDYVAFTGTDLVNEIYQLQIIIFELDTFTVTRIDQLDQFQSANFLAIQHLFWAP